MTTLQADILHVYSRIGIHNQSYIARLCNAGITTVRRVIKDWKNGKIKVSGEVFDMRKREDRQRLTGKWRHCLKCDGRFWTDENFRLCDRHRRAAE